MSDTLNYPLKLVFLAPKNRLQKSILNSYILISHSRIAPFEPAGFGHGTYIGREAESLDPASGREGD